jgi:hypothetical protein
MSDRRKSLNQTWFTERVREALNAADQGQNETAIDLLESLVDDCHEAARDSLSEWHKIQALGILGAEFERQNAHADAAAVYRRVADLRYAALQESGHGLTSALAAAAVASLRAGRRAAGRKLAKEALGLHSAYPLPKHDLEYLRREVHSADAIRVTRNLRGAVSNSVLRPPNRVRRAKRKAQR